MRYILIVALMTLIIFQMVQLGEKVYVVDLRPQKTDALKVAIQKAGMGVPEREVLEAIYLAKKQTRLSAGFLSSLVFTESSWRVNAVSEKGYHGLGQIPWKVYYPDVNVLASSRIYLEKLRMARGDKRKAIALYKGWGKLDKEGNWIVLKGGYAEADKVLSFEERLNSLM